jgi:hypothetical protein
MDVAALTRSRVLARSPCLAHRHVVAWMLSRQNGVRYGNAIADIIFGDVIPQAKLPLSFPNIENEQAMSPEQYPGIKTPEYSYQASGPTHP